ncbi:MAG: DoxX family protein [Anaerolineae bacterium]|jgi:uncharacterized membrane protein YphA (DoxX/SURF4 family)|nr:DoxX family protein [Anaerolineae bacterium]MBT7074694.1 DoxX family protein [Anaerolineae bacterium]MBT7781577.1 DoxX family protein [Anaerolineae bacterium]
MNTALWIVQGILAMMFLMAGMMKIKQTKEEMAEKMPWVEDFSQGQIRGIGIVEVMGALGLILPMVTGIMPSLTAYAALGLALTMVGAFLTHVRRKDPMVPMGMMNVMLFAMAAFVAYGRF